MASEPGDANTHKHTHTMQDWITEVKRDVDAQYAVNVLGTKSE